MNNSCFGCSGVTRGTRCSNMCATTSGFHQQDICYCMMKDLTTIVVVVSIFLSKIHFTLEDMQVMENS